jgi:hypothetical protein
VFVHVLRTFYFALSLLYNGFPSGTLGVPQIAFPELSLRLYHTSLLHDLGWTNTTEGLEHPAHAMTFELHGAFMTYEHLHAVAPTFDAERVGDIVQSIVLHTSNWTMGNSSATAQLVSLSVNFDIGGYDSLGPDGIDFNRLFNRSTVEEIEKAFPRGDFYDQGAAAIERETQLLAWASTWGCKCRVIALASLATECSFSWLVWRRFGKTQLSPKTEQSGLPNSKLSK